MTSSALPYDVIVVGAGLSGLLAAGKLQRAGLRVLALDKARGVGGRMATRRLDSLVADHGAQFFTAHDPTFAALVAEWVKAGVVRKWSTGFTVPDGTFKDNGVPRYCGVSGMTAITKHLAQGLEVRLKAKVTRIESREGGWSVTTDDGTTLASRAVIMTPPVPQSLALLVAGKVALPAAEREILEGIDYSSTLTVLAHVAGASGIPEPGGMWMTGEPLLWIGDNQRKGLSPNGTVITIHGGPEFSEANWDSPEASVIAAILEAAAPWLGSAVVQAQLHRWRYSVPLRVHQHPHLLVPELPPLVFAGDAFGGPRIEAAALSGLAAGDALVARLK
jgi:predicted NAD/FAD-dependent oxidoreductase